MRVLIAIGCDAYQHVGTLNGAERDARRMFECLVREEVGDYDMASSRLLLSPTINEVRECIQETLLSAPNVEAFTFFFAGHGHVSSSSFYMLVKDSRCGSLSMSGFSLADLFKCLNEARPNQTNIIIDACESGGLITDLSMLLKPELLGDAGTPSVTLVATAGKDQTAGETPIGGFGTSAILDCIEGKDFIQDSNSALDLVEIGRRISVHLAKFNQNPIVWGLNLYGPPSFCRNPRYGSDSTAPLRSLIQEWPSANEESAGLTQKSLWSLYNALQTEWEPEKFSSATKELLESCKQDSAVLSGLIYRLATTFSVRAQESDDMYRPCQVSAALASCLIPYTSDAEIAQRTQDLMDQCCAEIMKATESLSEELQLSKFAILSPSGIGMSELYYLPIRISKILGWSAASTLISSSDEQNSQAKDQFTRLLRFVLENYPNSVLAINDVQAPYWGLVIARAVNLGLMDEAELLVSLLFMSITDCAGKLCRCDLSADKVLNYLLFRNNPQQEGFDDLIERPIELLTVLLKAAPALNLKETFDESLWKLDGVSFLAYLPNDYKSFGDRVMHGGNNYVWAIGYDVFRVDDLECYWPSSAGTPQSLIDARLAIISSLLFPDRVAWFCIDALLGKGSSSPANELAK
ncbi:caspase family protein [Stutzerimonas stutzeri]|nr:caspase family protein [Stutzerimonas stutzeri]